MSVVMRIWLRAVLIVAMLFGCNMIAPAHASPVDRVPAVHAEGCHGSGSNGSGPTLACNSHCVALPAEVAHVRYPASIAARFEPAHPAPLTGQGLAPDIRPPRSA